MNNLRTFSINGEASILEEEHLGIFNGLLTTNVTFKDVLSFRGLYAPPYASSDFWLGIKVFGEKIPTEKYQWNFFEVRRSGRLRGISVSSILTLASGIRGVVLTVTLENKNPERKNIPFQFNIKGGLDYVRFWEFAQPRADKESATVYRECSYHGGHYFYYLDRHLIAGKKIIKENNAGAIVVGTNLENLKWEEPSSLWETRVSLRPKESKTFHVILTIGDHQKANDDCNLLLDNPEKAIRNSYRESSRKISGLFDKIPRLEATDKRLEKFYNRSLLPFILNQWQTPEFILHPYYSTGSINGGCVCSYLYDFGEGWEIFPLYDPAAAREHIKQFLKGDITSHFAFNPITGEAWGPVYQVNQEKIIFLIYYYVLHTGDVKFLEEEVNKKTILEWIIIQATFCDDLNKPGVLVDYGSKGQHHLELRGKYKYDYYMPDLNGRRYGNYLAVHRLCKLAGKKTAVDFSCRAEVLKVLFKDKMWSKKDGWFFNVDEKGNKYLRYTIQMYKLIGSGVLDKEEETGLLSHLNENEFLSEHGIHSMSKTDPAYDQADIDNGGGGSCVCFPPQIIERLYKSGHYREAEDILGRILWWGERMPYWGDSLVANNIDYRKDTPLQNAIGSIAGAQCIIFGMFGIKVRPEGEILINPRPPVSSPEISLTGLKIRGINMTVSVKKNEYKVIITNQIIREKIGTPVLFKTDSFTKRRGRH